MSETPQATLGTDQFRQQEFSRLLNEGHIYVDYTGGGQCPKSVIDTYHQLLLDTTFGNPHSHNPTSSHTTALVEQARQTVLDAYNAVDDYELIFTSNASGACKIFAESYPWTDNHVLILSRDNHNSVLGMREYAKRAGATIVYWDLTDELRLEDNLKELIAEHESKEIVVAFPAQSNFSGVMHPLEYVQLAQDMGATVFLDTAAFVPTHELNLQQVKADAACVSFYKILGFPTGLGALIIKKDVLNSLQKAWFAGGTVKGVSLENYVLEGGHERFENGTIDYALIPSLQYVYNYIHHTVGGIQKIEQHVTQLTQQALQGLLAMENVVVYGPHTMQSRGATIAFNILDEHGKVIPYEQVEKLAFERKISLRGGCFCNPGSGTCALDLGPAMMAEFLGKVQEMSRAEAGAPGAVRISFGIANMRLILKQFWILYVLAKGSEKLPNIGDFPLTKWQILTRMMRSGF